MFNHLRFADDIIVIGEELSEVEEMLKDHADARKSCGLNMNKKKTKVMKNTLAPQAKVP